MKKILEIHNVRIEFGQKIIHPEINFSAREGQLIALLGKNGIGKTTLFQILMRAYPTKNDATITLEGKALESYSDQLFSQRVSFVSSRREVVDYMRVIDFVLMGRFPYKKQFFFSAADKKMARVALEKLSLTNFSGRFISQLSDGEYQQVAIARALAQDTKIILLDEPTAFLDVGHKFSITETLKNIASSENKTIIFSSHDLSIVLKQADFIWLMAPKKTFMAIPEDLVWQQKLNSLFDRPGYYFDPVSMDFQKGECLENDEMKKLQIINLLTANAFRRFCVPMPDNLAIFRNGNLFVWKIGENSFSTITDCLFFIQEQKKQGFRLQNLK